MSTILIEPSTKEIINQSKKVLLLNAPAVDVRLPWARWHQPTGLLQIGSALQKRGCDIRFFDCLQSFVGNRIRRRKVSSLAIDGYDFDLWRFGMLWRHLASDLDALRKEDWIPDVILVSCFAGSWWKGAQQLIRRLKDDWLPGVPVALGGAYPTSTPDHAALHTHADVIVVGSISEARVEIPRLELYGKDRIPRFAGIYLYQSQNVSDVEVEGNVVPRQPAEVADEVADKAELGITEFGFFDEEIRLDEREHFLEVLEEIAKRELSIRFVAVGNISPKLIDGTMARKMGRANYRQVYLKCDVTHRPDGVIYSSDYGVYQSCTDALHREAEFKPRTDQLTAMLLVGNPFEDIEMVTERLVRLASIVGSVNLVPYQYSPGTESGRMYHSLTRRDNGRLDLTALNCKLYPLARRAGTPYEHYAELTRLAALLNSKFRTKTFDFLGDGLVAQAVQRSLRERTWDPFRADGEAKHKDARSTAALPSHEVHRI
jgi:hypothetical protein